MDEGWLDDDGFVDATLQDMTPQDITSFVAHWHDAVASGLDDGEDKAKLPELSQALTLELKKNSDLAKLATSPLLCAMICALHRDRNQALPNDRIGLYRACIEMFFRRDNERKMRLNDYLNLTDSQKLLLLRSFAWWLIRNGKSSATVAETHERLDHALTELNPPPKNATGEKVARLFIHRVAMLQQFATGKINFPHRTFQEFLAAQEALAEGDRQLIIDNAEKEQWREVAILAAGLIENKEDAESFVMALLLRGDQENLHQQSLYLIGAAARQNVSRLPDCSTLEAEASNRLKTIIPPKSMKAAQALSKAGNLVVPLLQYSQERNGKEVAASFRTLASINSTESRTALLEYARDTRTAVWKQIQTALQYVADDSRAELGALLLLKGLSARGLTESSADTRATLDLSSILLLMDCTSLAKCRSLETLALRSCYSLSDIHVLGSCRSLRTLDLYFCSSLKDVSGLENCQSLEELDLSFCYSLSDVSALGNCQSLQTLYLRSCPSLSDASVMELQRRRPRLKIRR